MRAPFEAECFKIDDGHGGRVQAYVRGVGGAPLVLVHSINAAASAYEVRPVFERYAASRATYALDLPGFGLSDRTDRPYSARLYTDAVKALVAHVRERHDGAKVDALALSLGCELLARAASEDSPSYARLALVSPTGFNGTTRREGPAESTRGLPGLHGFLRFGLWDDALYRALTRPSVIRFFLEKTFGGKRIDEGLFGYDVELVREPGAKFAPLWFLSGHLFSNDVTRVYESLAMPVWMAHGTRGDFVDYRGAEAVRGRANWRIVVFETGALPYFEVPEAFFAELDPFLAGEAP